MHSLLEIQKEGKLFANQYLLIKNVGRRGFIELWEVVDNLTKITQRIQVFDDQYILLKSIGKGGFSEVWLAKDSVSLVEFAIKIYSQTADLDDDGIAEFRKEFAVMCSLYNTNLLRPQTFNVSGRYPYLVLPFCKNGSANGLIGRMSEDDLWNFIKDVSYGLSYLHSRERPIIHRDIKPLNILINDQKQYLISDFGISTNLIRTMSRTQNDVVGTLQYMGSECHPKVGETKAPNPIIANDIWAFGATLYELATGTVPFGDYGGLTQRSLHKVPVIKKDYSQKLKDLIYLCLSEEPWDRPSADEIYEIARSKGEIHVSHPKHGQWKKAAGALAVFALLLVIVYFYPFKTPDPPIHEASDSLMLSKIDEANNIVNEQWQRSDRYDNFAKSYTISIIEAAIMHNQAMALQVSHDSIRLKAEKSWKQSQSIINKSYMQLDSLEQYYRAIPVVSVADSFAKRRMELEQYTTIKSIK